MPNTGFMMGSDQAGIAFNSNGAFAPLVGTLLQDTVAETHLQTVVRDAGTFHDMFIRCTAFTATQVFTFRKNAGNGNENQSVTGTGTFHDTTNQDAVVATDKIDYTITNTNNVTVTLISILFDSTTNFSTRGNTSTQQTYTTGSAFSAINGFQATNASNEAGVHTKMQKVGTMKFLQCILSANAKTATMTFVSRKNAGAGNMTMTIGIGATGIQEDSTNSDAIAVNDTWNSSRVAGTDTTHSTTWNLTAQDFITTNGVHQIQAAADADIAGTASVTRFVAMGGRFAFQATEANIQTNALAAFAYTNMCITHSGTTATNTIAVTFRKNTGNGNQTVTVGTATGDYQDTTNTDNVISTDAIDYQFVFGAGTQAAFSKISDYGLFATNKGFPSALNVSPTQMSTNYPSFQTSPGING